MYKHYALVMAGAFFLFATTCFGATFIPTSDELAGQTDLQKSNSLKSITRLLKDTVPGQQYVQIDDMLFRVDALCLKSGFYGNLWTEGKVYYEFDANVSANQHNSWIEAVNLWSNVANVSFIARTNEPNYIHVINSIEGVDSSAVGMVGGKQEMHIFSWGAPFAIAHEVGHALGLCHEHARSDRNDYVTVFTDNIQPALIYNFDVVASTNYGAYDFDSLMHYSRDACSKNGLNTIEPKPAYSQWINLMGQTDHLSFLDAWGMAQRYGGRGTLQSPTVTARTGWFGAGDVIVDWDAVPGATGYRIYYEESTDGPPYTPTQNGTPASGSAVGNVTEVTLSGLTPGQWYHVSLTAITTALESGYATPVTVRSLGLPSNDDSYEPNNDIAHAYDISDNMQDWLDDLLGRGKQRDDDWYSITLGSDQLRVQIRCIFNTGTGQVGIGVYTAAGNQLTYSSTTTGEQFLDVVVPEPGTYYIKVDGDNTGVSYDFTWNAFPAPSTQVGSLNVTIEPENARNDGAQWRVDSGAWQNSGVTLTGLTVGSHIVEYKDISSGTSSGCSSSKVASWTTPVSRTVEITANQTTVITDTYVLALKTLAAGLSGNGFSGDILLFSVLTSVLLVSRRRWTMGSK